ncbi:uncharacterized protein LOC133380986 [Rhineura floridana]|uniref:uncharacterized protein LOC133380986 n=1 Tax=Rhineura floridana TaxID=261503 RepID=UPI002AC83EDF|nr:uncharacterized protein LOC133380986 [Rhineura floridana]XP_061475281.1 uncharacterized protein LOC133380986 [Rhineura floridana]XP_061475283.1 uncharacterized protein LOC133380986 [Rhineura floridana]XP_061475284.1 uncharacterized protein LOC133380986 [Rhineura floridana]XP_061475285.1 uncharacterized protein LOC133380986 [Rhineura floridana]
MGACIPKPSPPAPLSVDSLLSAKKSLEEGNRGSDTMLTACLDHALLEFPREPHCLRDNATLTVQVRGRKRMEFVSGGGENKIVVSWLKKKTHYNIEISSLEVYLNRLSLCTAPLTSDNLEKVRQELLQWDDATKELRACLDVAITEIEKEPPSVKSNAELTIECGSSCLDFVSGKGRSRIHILFSDKQPRYQVRVSCMDIYVDRLSCRTMPLTSENLLKVWKETESLKGCTVDLRACLKRALQEFNALSPRHRANATIFIDCDGKNFKMVSGHGESWISVFNIVGDQHCRREVVLALAETGSSSRLTGPSAGKRGKEGPLFRVRKLEGRKGAEEGPSNQVRRTFNRPKRQSNGKRSKRGPPNVVVLEEFASSSWKGEEETTSFAGRTFSSGTRADTRLPNSSRGLGGEYILKLNVLSSSWKRKLSEERNGKEIELAGLQSLPSGTVTEEVLIHGKSEDMGPSFNGSSEEEEGEPTDVLEETSDSRQADGGPER